MQIDTKTQTPSDYNLNVIAQSHTMINDVSARLWVITWPGKLRVYVDAFKAFVHEALRREIPSSCLTGTSPTASIPSRGRIYQDQVAPSHTRYAGSSEASRPHQHQNKIQLNTMLTEAFSTQATSQKQHRRTPLPLPVSAMCQLRLPVV